MTATASFDHPHAESTRAARGFTLIELMVVIVILGLLIGLVVPNVWHALTKSTNDTAEAQMNNIASAINMYYLDQRSLPATLDELTQDSKSSGQPYMAHLPKDPWNQPYDYKITNRSRHEFEILCSGEDKTWGTEDDLVFPKKEDGK